jgi:hypothetical protein
MRRNRSRDSDLVAAIAAHLSPAPVLCDPCTRTLAGITTNYCKKGKREPPADSEGQAGLDGRHKDTRESDKDAGYVRALTRCGKEGCGYKRVCRLRAHVSGGRAVVAPCVVEADGGAAA